MSQSNKNNPTEDLMASLMSELNLSPEDLANSDENISVGETSDDEIVLDTEDGQSDIEELLNLDGFNLPSNPVLEMPEPAIVSDVESELPSATMIIS